MKMLKKSFFVALVAMLVAFCAGTAMAVNTVNGIAGTQIDGMVASDGGALPAGLLTHINPGGLGDALIYGYYNVRNGANIFNIVNTSDVTAIKARVRFREGERSAEVLDFNVCLSAGDRWTALILGSATGPAVLFDVDGDTLTAPDIPAAGVPFKFAPENPADHVTSDLTQEGYIEIIGAVAISDPTPPTSDPWDATTCSTGAWIDSEVPNSLMGSIQIVPLDTLESYGYAAWAVANCCQAFGGCDAPITTDNPNFLDCADSFAGIPYGLDYSITKSAFNVAFDTDASTYGGETSLVVTFPTMHFHDADPTVNGFDYASNEFVGEVLAGGALNLFDDDGPGVTCWGPEIEVGLGVWDNAENRPTSTVGFSPTPEEERNIICNEVNVIEMGSSANVDTILASTVALAAGFETGWIDLGLTVEPNHFTDYPVAAPQGNRSSGLPALGLVLESLGSGVVTGANKAQYETRVTTP